MANRLFQGVVHQMRDAVDRTVGVIDETFTIIACSELGLIGQPVDITAADITVSADLFTRGNYTYKPFGTAGNPEYVMFVEGTDQQAVKYVSLMAVALINVKQYFDEKFDRSNFVKNVILDNILPGDIYIKARELRFNMEAAHAVLLIRMITRNDVSVYDVIQNLFPDKQKDFIINISETEIALVKETRSNIEAKDLEKLARSIVDTLSSEFYVHAVVGIGSTVEGVRELAKSFKEAQIALEVGKVFDTEKTIIS